MNFRHYILQNARRAVFFVFGFAVIIAARADIPLAEKILPEDTLFVFCVPDFTKMRAIYEKSPQSRLWNDSALKPFHDKFVTKWKDEFIEPLERDLGIKLEDFSSLPQGQLTLAMTQEGWNGVNDASPGLVLLLDARDKSDQLKKSIADLRKKWTDAGKALKTEKIRNIDFLVVPLSTNDMPIVLKQFFPQKSEEQELGKEPEKKSPRESKLVIGQFESLLIVTSSSQTAERIVSHLTGGNAPALDDDPVFNQNRLTMFRDAAFFGWLNAKSLFDIVSKSPDEKPNPQAPSIFPQLDAKKILTSIGLGGVKSIAIDFKDTGDGTIFEVLIGAPESGRQGLVKLLSPETKDSSPPAFVPADAVKFQRWRIDGQKALATLEKILGDISPQFLNTWNFLLKSGEEGMKVTDADYDIRKNLFANLGDDIVTYEKSPRGTSIEQLNSPPSLFAIGSPNAEQLARAMPGLLALRFPDALQPKVRDFLGRKIYSVTMPSSSFDEKESSTRQLSYAASGGYVAFSTDTATLEEFLRSAESSTKPLREIAGLADAAQRVGGQSTGMFSYENQAETMRIAFETYKRIGATNSNSFSSNPLSTALPFAGPERSVKDMMDFSLLPDFAKVSKYFHFSVWANNVTTDGLVFKFYSPTPPALK